MERAELEAIETVLETHISRVYLRGQDVIKVKKPVSLGFLDFRSLPQRRAACEAEEKLGARLAPDVYLGVVPVRVDWGVRMRRLPDEARADNLLASLDADAITAIARRIAEFHRAARCDAETARFGAPEVIRRNVEENFAQTEGALERFLERDQIAEITRW